MTPRRAASSSAPIRLTRRGRIVVTCLVVALCAGLLLLMTSTRSDPQSVPSFDAPLGALDESKVPNGWGPLVAAASRESGVPGAVLAAQLEVESKWNPKAVSHANAKGLAQFTPDAWASHGKGDPFDPADAIAAQGRLMRELKQRAERSGIADNPMRLALAGYNAGFGNVTKYQASRRSRRRNTTSPPSPARCASTPSPCRRRVVRRWAGPRGVERRDLRRDPRVCWTECRCKSQKGRAGRDLAQRRFSSTFVAPTSGGPCGARTHNLRIKSPQLCQLS